MIEKLDRKQLIALERETNSSLAPIYRAIANDQYDILRDELSKESFDINQSATTAVQLPEKITLEDDYTPMAYAIEFGKTALIELFLLMGANPHGGHSNLNPINLIDEEKNNSATNTLMKNIFMQYQNLGQYFDINQCVDNHQIYTNGPFIDAIKSGNSSSVEELLSKGLIYTDQCCHNTLTIALALAVESKSFETVALLVQRGAAISNYMVRLLLNNHSQEPWCQRIATLLQLEKQKQSSIMALFCSANGDLKVCREAIDDINRQYKDKVMALKDGQAISMEWNNYSAMQTQILPQNESSTSTRTSPTHDDEIGSVGSSTAFNLRNDTSGNCDQNQGVTADQTNSVKLDLTQTKATLEKISQRIKGIYGVCSKKQARENSLFETMVQQRVIDTLSSVRDINTLDAAKTSCIQSIDLYKDGHKNDYWLEYLLLNLTVAILTLGVAPLINRFSPWGSGEWTLFKPELVRRCDMLEMEVSQLKLS